MSFLSWILNPICQKWVSYLFLTSVLILLSGCVPTKVIVSSETKLEYKLRACEDNQILRGYKGGCMQDLLAEIDPENPIRNPDIFKRLYMIDNYAEPVEDNFSHAGVLRQIVHFTRNDKIKYRFKDLKPSSQREYAPLVLRKYQTITTYLGSNSLVNLSQIGFFYNHFGFVSLDSSLIVDAVEKGGHILHSVGNYNKEGPGFESLRKKELVDAISSSEIARSKILWVSGINEFGETERFTRCKGVENYCILVNAFFKIEDHLDSKVKPMSGTSMSTAFAFAVFSLAWERLPEGTSIDVVFNLARRCTPVGASNGRLKATPERGLGILSVSCLIESANAYGRDKVPEALNFSRRQ